MVNTIYLIDITVRCSFASVKIKQRKSLIIKNYNYVTDWKTDCRF